MKIKHTKQIIRLGSRTTHWINLSLTDACLKLGGETQKKKVERGQYLLVVGLDCYRWYHSLTPDDVSARRLNPGMGGHEVMCEQGRWIRRGRFGGVPH